MPTYDYACGQCGPFEAMRSIACRAEPVACPQCTSPAERAWLTAPRLASMSSQRRHAMSTNERASHEPKSSKDKDYTRLKHPSGCGCCSASKSKVTATAPNGNKSFPSKRPWMISH